MRDDGAVVAEGIDEFVHERGFVKRFAGDFVGAAKIAGCAGGEAVAEGGGGLGISG